jgi:adenylate cyclase
MPFEVERKFLVANDDWKAKAVRSVFLRDGLIASSNGNKVRIRIADEKATVTIKGPRKSMSRAEFEYDIPASDAEAILTHMCQGHTLEKRRHFVEHSNVTWEIDVYEGSLQGIVIAEIEQLNCLTGSDRKSLETQGIGKSTCWPLEGTPDYRKNVISHAIKVTTIPPTPKTSS